MRFVSATTPPGGLALPPPHPPLPPNPLKGKEMAKEGSPFGRGEEKEGEEREGRRGDGGEI